MNRFLLLLVAVSISACARTVTFDQPAQIKEVAAKVKVKLDPVIVALKEMSSAFGGAESGTYDVGKAMRYFFENDANAGSSCVNSCKTTRA